MSLRGHLEERFGTEHPRKLLALDGGGIRGVLTLEILAENLRKIGVAIAKTEVNVKKHFCSFIHSR